MKTKLLAMMVLAGGSMFAQTRVSMTTTFGEHGAGFNRHQVAPRFDNRFNDGHDRQRLARGFEQDQNRDFDQDRNLGEQDRDQARGFNPAHTSDFGQRQSDHQNSWDHSRSNGQDDREWNAYASGFRGR
jgi:hypothetical protein